MADRGPESPPATSLWARCLFLSRSGQEAHLVGALRGPPGPPFWGSGGSTTSGSYCSACWATGESAWLAWRVWLGRAAGVVTPPRGACVLPPGPIFGPRLSCESHPRGFSACHSPSRSPFFVLSHVENGPSHRRSHFGSRYPSRADAATQAFLQCWNTVSPEPAHA